MGSFCRETFADQHLQWVLLRPIYPKLSFKTEDVDRELLWMVSHQVQVPDLTKLSTDKHDNIIYKVAFACF